MADARVSQQAVESISGMTADARVSQQAIESVSTVAASARISQQVVELVCHTDAVSGFWCGLTSIFGMPAGGDIGELGGF